MRRTCAFIILTLFVVSMTDGATLTRKKRQAVQINSASDCPAGTTFIVTRSISTTDWTSCPVGIVPQEYEAFVNECDYWMGTSTDHVAGSYVYRCLPNSSGGVTIRANVCCKGVVPSNRCITYKQCPKNDLTECDYDAGSITTCAADERCETRMSCPNVYEGANSVAVKSCVKSCSSQTQCASKAYLKSGESCATCCTGAFCNKGGQLLTCDASGECNCPNMVSGNYHCSNNVCTCITGCTGSNCGTCSATCSPNPCVNGGRCEATSSGIKCCCKSGYSGSRCEIAMASCDNNYCSNQGVCFIENNNQKCRCNQNYYGDRCQQSFSFSCPDARNVMSAFGAPYTETCANLANTMLSRTSELSACTYHMRDKYANALFIDGVHGHVTEVTDAAYGECNVDTCGKAIYSTRICCPSCYSSPCQNGGYCVQVPLDLQRNSPRDYVCRCKFGFTGDFCEKRVQTCFVFGEPHFIMFSGRKYSFQGSCKYILSSSRLTVDSLPDFSIYLQNEHRGTDKSVSYPSSIEIRIGGYIIIIGRNKVVSVQPPNGAMNQVSLPADYGGVFNVRELGLIVVADIAGGLVRAGYDGHNLAYVQVSDNYRSLLAGLCGDPDDDTRDCNGVPQDNSAAGDTARGDSCLVLDQVEGECDTPAPTPCDSTSYQTNDWCGQIINTNGPFGACAGSRRAKMMYESCLFDVCRNQSNKCAALESFAAICKSEQYTVSSKWRDTTNCPVKCPENSVYVSSASACQPTCENLHADKSCPEGNVEVCVCSTGYILQDGKCIPSNQCGCRDQDNIRRQFGDIWDVDTDKCQQKICSQCSVNCTVPGKVEFQTSPAVNGGWGEWSTWSACDVATNQLKRTRSCDQPEPECDGQGCTGSGVETMQCPTGPTSPIPTPTPTPPPQVTPSPSCTPFGDFQKACHECDRTVNPLLYLKDPCSCGYYQCQPLEVGYKIHKRNCPTCTCWNDNIKTCERVTGVGCINVGPTYVNYCTIDTTRFSANADPYFYNQHANGITYKMPCAPGTKWNQTECTCVWGGPINRKHYMCLTFDDKNNPLASSLYVSQIGTVTYGHPGVVSYAAEFNQGSLEVPGFTNKEIWSGTLILYFRVNTVNRAGSMTLVSNDDCGRQPSILIRLDISSSGQAVIRAGIRTTVTSYIDTLTFDATRMTTQAQTWHQLALTYDAHAREAVLYIDGNRIVSRPADGAILAVHCPLRFGSTYSAEFYYGQMDQICYYDRAFSASEVLGVYSADVQSP